MKSKNHTAEPADDRIDAGYVRVSTETQAEEGYSVGAQSDKLNAFCALKEYHNIRLYVDGGWSGSNLERPQMRQLIDDIHAGKIRRVVVYKLDRLSRSQKDTLFLIEDVFLPNQVDFVSLAENIDTSTAYGRAMIGILSAFAQLERENIFMRTRMGMVERVKQGYWMGGGRTPFGYDYDRVQGTLVPNADAVKVREMYELYIRGYSAGRLARLYGVQNERLITQILQRKSNTGIIVYKGEEYQGKHTPLISTETYLLAMQKMRERAVVRTTSAAHLLSGLCLCGHCGAKLRYLRWGKAGYKLSCYSHDKSKTHLVRDPDCPNENVWAEDVEAVVLRDLFQLSADLTDKDWGTAHTLVSPCALLEQRIHSCKAKMKRLYNLYAACEDDTLLETIQENKSELAALSEQLSAEQKHQTRAKHLHEISKQMLDIGQNWTQMTSAEKQSIIRDCVDKIIVKDGKLDVFYKLETPVAMQNETSA